MGQAFWTGVRLPSSPPVQTGAFERRRFFYEYDKSIIVNIDKAQYIEYNEYG